MPPSTGSQDETQGGTQASFCSPMPQFSMTQSPGNRTLVDDESHKTSVIFYHTFPPQPTVTLGLALLVAKGQKAYSREELDKYQKEKYAATTESLEGVLMQFQHTMDQQTKMLQDCLHNIKALGYHLSKLESDLVVQIPAGESQNTKDNNSVAV
eukprot:3933749-Rhodomonas_salina.2